MVGAGFGFLFGIPRTLQSSAAPRSKAANDTTTSEDANAHNAGVAGNTNLERVSDWLTGMLVGAGLVELERLKSLFLKLVDALASGFSGSSDREPFAYALSLFLVPYFLVSGFLAGYILTRRYLPRTFLSAEMDGQQIQRRENRLLAMVMRAVKDLVGPTATLTSKMAGTGDKASASAPNSVAPQPPAPLDAAVPATVPETALMNAPPTHDIAQGESASPPSALPSKSAVVENDPNKGKFGWKPEHNGRRLSAQVTPLAEGVSDFFRVRLEVKSGDASRPLEKPVTFYLHPTFARQRETVNPRNGTAVLELVVWGSFTVGAVTDDGATSLELDLAQLPDVPQYFRER